mgnify:CR=1 FL=1
MASSDFSETTLLSPVLVLVLVVLTVDLSIFSSFLLSQITGDLKVALLRVSFPINDYPGVSSNGDFLYSTDIDEYQCGDYTIDPPPHDKNYFK